MTWIDRILFNPKKLLLKNITTGAIQEYEIQPDLSNVQVDGTPIQAISMNAIENRLNLGWIDLPSLTYLSTDGPMVTVITASDLTGIVSVGQKFRYIQGGVTKYGIIHAVTATTLLIYGGTDYTLANSAISNPCFSMVKSPFGFPMNPDKWTITVISSGGTKASPTQNTWYYTEFGSVNIPLHIGSWNVSYQLTQGCNRSASSDLDNLTALSLSSTAQSGGISTRIYTIGLNITLNQFANIPITVTAKTLYYLIGKTQMSSVAGIAIQTITLKAVCAYL